MAKISRCVPRIVTSAEWTFPSLARRRRHRPSPSREGRSIPSLARRISLGKLCMVRTAPDQRLPPSLPHHTSRRRGCCDASPCSAAIEAIPLSDRAPSADRGTCAGAPPGFTLGGASRGYNAPSHASSCEGWRTPAGPGWHVRHAGRSRSPASSGGVRLLFRPCGASVFSGDASRPSGSCSAPGRRLWRHVAGCEACRLGTCASGDVCAERRPRGRLF
jgi:hypothetical protein